MHILQKSLANPYIHFRLTHNKQLLLNLHGGQGLQTRIQQIFGEEFLDTIFPVNHEETSLGFSGFISFPSGIKQTNVVGFSLCSFNEFVLLNST